MTMKMGTLEKQFVNAATHSRRVAEHAIRRLRHVPLQANWSFLDIGCGNGAATLHVADTLGLRAVGVDVDAAQIALARAAAGHRTDVSFVTGSATDLPFPTGEFDIVFTNKALHHVPEWARALDEIKRVVRPGGYVVFADLTAPSAIAPVLRRTAGHLAGVFTQRDLDRCFAGMRVVHRRAGWLQYEGVFGAADGPQRARIQTPGPQKAQKAQIQTPIPGPQKAQTQTPGPQKAQTAQKQTSGPQKAQNAQTQTQTPGPQKAQTQTPWPQKAQKAQTQTPAPQKAQTQGGWRRIAGVVALMVGVAIVGYVSGATAVTTAELREWVHGFSRLAPVVFVGLFAALNTLGLPVPVLGAAGGAVFGLFEGAAVTLCAMWVTACLQFLVARHVGGERLRQQFGARLGRVGHLLERRGVLAVAAGRLLPGPFSELNMAAGLTPLTFWNFAIGTLLGCAPKAAAWSAVGTALG
jgi:uncharacterized membrane protein YdjX (TVP38/TMEM64 family)/SAM-dependent methyltransferase